MHTSFLAEELERVVQGRHPDPSRMLGPQPQVPQTALIIRAFAPGAERAVVRLAGEELPAAQIHPAGVFEAETDSENVHSPASYRWRFFWPDGRERSEEHTSELQSRFD